MEKKKILVVDDDSHIILALKTRLEANDYSVISAVNGAEGIKKAKEEKPDLILLDILMSDKDGLVMLGELKAKESTKQIPVIILTAKDESSYLLKTKELGIADYIVKPYNSQKLLESIKRHI